MPLWTAKYPAWYSAKPQSPKVNIVRLALLGLFLCCAYPAQAQPPESTPEHPAALWEKSEQWFAQAKAKARQRRVSEAIVLFSRSKALLQDIRGKWPQYRRLQISRQIHAIHQEIGALYRLVAEQGLVEFRGKFYSFEQVREMLQFQKERTEKWMELLKAQEEVRRLKTERMVEEESKRQVKERQAQQEKYARQQERFQREWKNMQEENRRNREAALQRDQQRQRAEQEERRARQLR